MTKTPTTTTTAPQFGRAGGMLAEPIAPRLVGELKPGDPKRHAGIAERLAASSRRLAELRARIADAPRADKVAAAEAVARGEEVPPSGVERLQGEYREAQPVHEALQAGLRRSANELLALAHPLAGEVADEIDAEIAGAIEDVYGDLQALHERLLALAETLAEASWTRALAHADGGSFPPFQRGRSPLLRSAVGDLDTVREALQHDLDAYEERQRQARDQREHQRQVDKQWAGERTRQAGRADADVTRGS